MYKIGWNVLIPPIHIKFHIKKLIPKDIWVDEKEGEDKG